MHLNFFFTSLAFAVAFAGFAKADTIVAFSGSTCDGDAGDTVQCDGSCHLFGGRHSLLVSLKKTAHTKSRFDKAIIY